MRLLIAGCGYVGERLLATWPGAVGLRRSPAEASIQADLEDPAALRALRGEFDAVAFMAAPGSRSDEAYRRTYVTGLQNVIEAIRPERLVFASSTAVYHQQDGEIVDEASPTEPTSFTGQRLFEAEQLARNAGGSVLRFGGIYGPGRTALIRRVNEGVALKERWTNRIHRDDCAAMVAHVLRVPEPAATYIGVDNDSCLLSEVTGFIAAAMDRPAPNVEGEPSGKRCQNHAIRSSGFAFRYPSYRAGYPAVIGAYVSSA